MSPLRITLIQSVLHWEDRDANLRMFEEKIRSIKEPTHVVVLPEMFTTGFSMRAAALAEPMDGPSVSWMKKMAAEKRVIITGSLIIEEEGKYYNRLIWMLPNGQMGIYNKRHLFAYAGEDQYYTPGRTRFIASVNGWKLNLMVCYDLRFPVWARLRPDEQGQPEYDALVFMANWPDRRSHAWRTLLQARAIENQCYVVGVNRVGEDANGHHYRGDSLVADPLGELAYHKAEEEDIATITLDPTHLQAIREKLPFQRDADDFDLLA